MFIYLVLCKFASYVPRIRKVLSESRISILLILECVFQNRESRQV